VPNLLRSLIFSVAVLFLLSYPLRYLGILFVWLQEIGLLLEEDVHMTDITYWSLFIILLFITNIGSDYLSFIKTRTILEKFSSWRFPYREITIVILDILLSIAICLAVSGVVTGTFWTVMELRDSYVAEGVFVIFFCLLIGIGVFLKSKRFSIPLIIIISGLLIMFAISLDAIGDVVDDIADDGLNLSSLMEAILDLIDPWMMWIVSSPGPFVFSFLTSLSIAILSLFVVVVQLVQWLVWRIESKRIWDFLNFEEKPSQSAAVIVIVLFTFFYWPIVFLLS
jgi:hypothetical protein